MSHTEHKSSQRLSVRGVTIGGAIRDEIECVDTMVKQMQEKIQALQEVIFKIGKRQRKSSHALTVALVLVSKSFGECVGVLMSSAEKKKS